MSLLWCDSMIKRSAKVALAGTGRTDSWREGISMKVCKSITKSSLFSASGASGGKSCLMLFNKYLNTPNSLSRFFDAVGFF